MGKALVIENSDFNIQDVLNRIKIEEAISLNFDIDEYNEKTVGKMLELYKAIDKENLIDLKKNPFEILLMQKRIETQTFSKDELNNLKPICQMMGEKLMFTDNYYTNGEESHYTYEMVENTYKTIDGIVKEIKGKNLSPAEEYVYVILKLFKKPYRDYDPTLLNDEKLENLLSKFRCRIINTHLSRSVNGVCNSDYIVCAGYSFMLMSICQQLGIKCFTQGVLLETKRGEKIPHRINVVFLSDEKYGINDWQSTDITNLRQVGSDKKAYANLNFLLYPLSDIENIRNSNVYFYENFSENRQQFIDSPLNNVLNKDGIVKTDKAYMLALVKGLVLQNYKVAPPMNVEELFEKDIDSWSKMVDEEFDKFIKQIKNNSRPIDVQKILTIYKTAIDAMEDNELEETAEGSIKYSVEFAKTKSNQGVSLGFNNFDEEIE